jgi:hypothetical protein
MEADALTARIGSQCEIPTLQTMRPALCGAEDEQLGARLGKTLESRPKTLYSEFCRDHLGPLRLHLRAGALEYPGRHVVR